MRGGKCFMAKSSKLFGYPNSVRIFCGVTTLFLINGALSLMNPAIASMSAAYPDIPLSTIMLLATIPSVTGMITSLLIGPIVKVLKYKGSIFCGLILFVLTGIAPFFFQDNFTVILVFRAINGLARGIIAPLTMTVAAIYYEGYANAKVLGLGNTIANISGLIFASVGGIIATGSVHNIWFLNIVLIVPVFFWLTLKEPVVEDYLNAQQIDDTPKVKARIPGITWVYVLISALTLLFMYPFQLYTSSIIAESGMGDAATSGLVLTFWSVGGIAAGFVIDYLMKLFKGRTLGVFSAGMLFMMCIFAFSNSVPMFIVGVTVGGFSYAILCNACFAGMGNTAPDSVRGTVMGITSAINSVIIFICTYVMNFIAGIFGKLGDLRFQMVICAAAFAVFTVLFLIKKMDVIGGDST